MRLYHRTGDTAVYFILNPPLGKPRTFTFLGSHFHKGTDSYYSSQELGGVWLTDHPAGKIPDARGNILLEFSIDLTDSDLMKYEEKNGAQRERQFLIPAKLLDEKASVLLVEVTSDGTVRSRSIAACLVCGTDQPTGADFCWKCRQCGVE